MGGEWEQSVTVTFGMGVSEMGRGGTRPYRAPVGGGGALGVYSRPIRPKLGKYG